MRIRFQRQARETPDSIGGVAVAYPPAKRNAPRWRWYAILLIVLSPIIVLVLGLLGSFLTRSANGSVTLDQVEVRAVTAGRVLRVVTDAGADVMEGDAVAEIEDLAAVRSRTAGGANTGGRVRRTRSPEADAELALRARALRLAEERRDSLEALLQGGAATRAELREAEGAVDQAAAAFLRTRRDLGLETTDVPVLVSRPGAASLSYSNRTPSAGRVLDVFVTEGEIVSAGDPLVLVGRRTEPKVTAYVSPQFATRIRPGVGATIRFADGTSADAVIAEPARVTRRMPADLVDPFGMRPMMVVLKLRAAESWPATQTIHGLPVRVRFHYAWEGSAVGRWLGRALDILAGSP
jgi:multidrug resistance efflux pump